MIKGKYAKWLWVGASLVWAASASALFALRPVTPASYPPLTLRRADMQAALRRDARVASETVSAQLQPSLDELRRRYLDQGLAEVSTRETKESDAQRNYARRLFLDSLHPSERARLSAQTCVWATHRVDELVHSAPMADWPHDLVGTFAAVMERYGIVAGGTITGPTFVFRTLFKARCNAILQQPLTHGMQPVERQAYHGWLALHVTTAPAAIRQKAIDEYARAGGIGAHEARGVWSFEQGLFREAAQAFEQGHRTRGALWLRNYHRAAATAQGVHGVNRVGEETP
jgi:hypothetical protein